MRLLLCLAVLFLFAGCGGNEVVKYDTPPERPSVGGGGPPASSESEGEPDMSGDGAAAASVPGNE